MAFQSPSKIASDNEIRSLDWQDENNFQAFYERTTRFCVCFVDCVICPHIESFVLFLITFFMHMYAGIRCLFVCYRNYYEHLLEYVYILTYYFFSYLHRKRCSWGIILKLFFKKKNIVKKFSDIFSDFLTSPTHLPTQRQVTNFPTVNPSQYA